MESNAYNIGHKSTEKSNNSSQSDSGYVNNDIKANLARGNQSAEITGQSADSSAKNSHRVILNLGFFNCLRTKVMLILSLYLTHVMTITLPVIIWESLSEYSQYMKTRIIIHKATNSYCLKLQYHRHYRLLPIVMINSFCTSLIKFQTSHEITNKRSQLTSS
jgi:hypothetical protein